jgi:hypothetical protein
MGGVFKRDPGLIRTENSVLKCVDDLSDLKGLKNFKNRLTRPIETLKGKSSRTDVAFAASLFMFRKAIPAGVDTEALVSTYIEKMTRDQVPNLDFQRFAAKELDRLFPIGWDFRYAEYCGRALPSSGASFGTGRKHGGARRELAEKMSRTDYELACLKGIGITMHDRRRISLVDDNGKVRIVTIADAAMQVLGPLHHLLYDHIARRDWLLKGEATANSFKEFVQVKDEVFVSGDYESATDNFNSHHSFFILDEILKRSRHVPEAIKDIALSSLRAVLEHGGQQHQQTAGQLMGNLLSFPLLCITNFLAFKMAVPRRVPLKINGDDIVSRLRPEEFEKWKHVVGLAGLTLSVGKTLVHRRYFSLNSCFFEARRGRKPSTIPIIRAKAIYARLDRGDGSGLAARLVASCKGMCGWQKGKVRTHILRWHRKSVVDVECSLNRGLGVRIPHEAIAASGFLDRELYHLSKPSRFDKPRELLPVEGPGPNGPRITWGWTSLLRSSVPRVERQGFDDAWGEHCTSWTWQWGIVPVLNKRAPAIWRYVELHSKRYARLMRQTVRSLNRLRLSHSRKIPAVKKYLYEPGRSLRKPTEMWVPTAEMVWKRLAKFAPSKLEVEAMTVVDAAGGSSLPARFGRKSLGQVATHLTFEED